MGQLEKLPDDAAQADLEKARFRLEQVKLDRELRQLSMPWWRSWNLTAIGAFIAAIVPSTAALTGYFEKQKQVELQQIELDNKIRVQYLNLAIDPTKTEADRQQILRFLQLTLKGSPIGAWAESELNRVNEELTALNNDLKAKQSKIDENAAKIYALERQVSAQTADTKPLAELRSLQAEREGLRSEVAKIRVKTTVGGAASLAWRSGAPVVTSPETSLGAEIQNALQERRLRPCELLPAKPQSLTATETLVFRFKTRGGSIFGLAADPPGTPLMINHILDGWPAPQFPRTNDASMVTVEILCSAVGR